MLRVVVMVSGGGTNLQAILDAVDNGKITNAELQRLSATMRAFMRLSARKNTVSQRLL